eukprot:g4165.t1
MAALGFSDNPDAALGEWVDEKNFANGNWFYESVRKIAMRVMFTLQPLHYVFPYTGYAEKVKDVAACRSTIDILALDDWEVKQLHDVFQVIDVDGGGTLSIKEFYDFFSFSFVTPLAVRYFEIFDDDKSGELSFCEFVVAAWNFCANCDKIGMINFAFDVYDMDRSGYIDATEATQLLVEAFGERKRMNENTLRLVGQLEKMEDMDVQMPKSAFVAFVRKHDSIFFPIFTLQREMRKHICGFEFWNRIRKTICKRSNIVGRKAANFDLLHCRKAIQMSQESGDSNSSSDNSLSSKKNSSPLGRSSTRRRKEGDVSDTDSVVSDASAMSRASTFSTAMKRGARSGKRGKAGKRKDSTLASKKSSGKAKSNSRKKSQISVKEQLKKHRIKFNGKKSTKKKKNSSSSGPGNKWNREGTDNDDASSVASFALKARTQRQSAWMS